MDIPENILFVVAGDHGQQFMEHGNFGHPPFLYDALLHVPLAFYGLNVEGGNVVADLVSLIDVAPTTLGLLDIESPRQSVGRDITKERREYVIAEEFLQRSDIAQYGKTMTDPMADYLKRKTACRTDR